MAEPTVEQLKATVKAKNITRWNFRHCPGCSNPYGIIFSNDKAYFDGKCGCVKGPFPPQERDWSEVLDLYKSLPSASEFWGELSAPLPTFSQIVKTHSFGITWNANDYFGPYADAFVLSFMDYDWAIPFIEEHGSLAVDAIMCHVRKARPWKQKTTPELEALIKKLEQLNPTLSGESQ
jgi:hypothetical protein